MSTVRCPLDGIADRCGVRATEPGPPVHFFDDATLQAVRDAARERMLLDLDAMDDRLHPIQVALDAPDLSDAAADWLQVRLDEERVRLQEIADDAP